ncbi:MAG TPA: S41 family peptidase [Streptosporangiaceae bacterium]|nr:S41 family peptidase [Streptosporangiaceae bacterium]
MNRRRRTGRVLRALVLCTALICAYGAGVATGAAPGMRAAQQAREAQQSSSRTVLDEAADRLSTDAAEPVSRAELDRAAINGMLERLNDRWARYYDAREFDDVQGRLNGRYSGVGLWLGTADDESTVRIASVQPGSPAERAGVRTGDIITAVGGASVIGWSLSKIATALRGEPSSGVELVVRRGAAQLHFRLVRAAARAADVTVAQPAEHVQLIRLTAFTRGVAREIRDVLARSADRHSAGVLLDLRGNPGGLLDEAVATASAFLPGGPVVTYQRRGSASHRLFADGGGDTRTPLVVLVDAGTASAAEVVAGSLRDRDRAVIVGSRTFGKGSIQEPVRLPDGSAIELTVGRYLTPAGRNLDGVGVEPDVVVSADRLPREAEHRALTVLRGLLATVPADAGASAAGDGGRGADRVDGRGGRDAVGRSGTTAAQRSSQDSSSSSSSSSSSASPASPGSGWEPWPGWPGSSNAANSWRDRDRG